MNCSKYDATSKHGILLRYMIGNKLKVEMNVVIRGIHFMVFEKGGYII